MNALLVMILVPGFVLAISSASRAQQLPFSIMTVSPGETSFAASAAIRRFSS